MLGGGTFLTQNKVLPGAYINFVSAHRANIALGDRGYVAMPIELDWGAEEEIITCDVADFQKESLKLFGYDFTDRKMLRLRELFKGAKTAYLMRTNIGGEKAKVVHGDLTVTAKHSGIRGNDIRVVIGANVDAPSSFDVTTYMGDTKVDIQTGATIAELKPNDFVVFSGSGAITATAGATLQGGTNKTTVKGAYTTFLDKIESYAVNIIAYAGTDESVKSLFVEFVKRMRDAHGIKMQAVLYKKSDADYEGIISLDTAAKGEDVVESDLIYWIAGKEAGVNINRSLVNVKYDGELALEVNYKQRELEQAIKSGKVVLHKVGDAIRVLDDINTFVSFTKDKNEDFAQNQIIRILDQDAIETAKIFNERYLGKVNNDHAGRIALWADYVALGEELQRIGALTEFKSEDIKVEIGSSKNAVLVEKRIKPVVAMTKLYVTVIVE
ncbi:MAG: phage tail sheath family protein [Peptostreptococcaceae bacterium]|nr:phage tail sheath family protein [Peptostreptococcaceae bacterium]